MNKIYTLTKSPTPEAPYLHSIRHKTIIELLDNGENACHTVNAAGEIDFYYLLPDYNEIEDLSEGEERIELKIYQRHKVILELLYGENTGLTGYFTFDCDNPLERYSLEYIAERQRINLFYITILQGEYVCAAMKTVLLAPILCYELQRFLQEKEILSLPSFAEKKISGNSLKSEVLLRKGWGFYFDYSALQVRLKNKEVAEEILSRHVLHGLRKLQENGTAAEKKHLLVWEARFNALNNKEKPTEIYAVFISEKNFLSDTSLDKEKIVLENTLKELSEFEKCSWISPLAEEALPLIVIKGKNIHKLEWDDKFFTLCHELFQRHHAKHCDYENYYLKVLQTRKNSSLAYKVFDLAEKRKKKGFGDNILPYEEILSLIEEGKAENLPLIFHNLSGIDDNSLDEILVSLCEKFRKTIEPYFMEYLANPDFRLKATAMMGLGMIESKKAIPLLADSLRGGRREASYAKYSLALIGDRAFPYVAPFLKDKRAEIRVRAVETLALLGSNRALMAIKKMARDRSIKVEEAKKRVLQFYDQ